MVNSSNYLNPNKTNSTMKTTKLNKIYDIPKNYTGIVEFSRGRKEWFLNGQLHRTDGPAIIWPSGTKKWLLNGQLHRTNGPAIEYSDGRKEYWLNDEFLDEQKIDQFVDELDYPIKVAIKLVYLLEMNES